jgi:hypothetical protein
MRFLAGVLVLALGVGVGGCGLTLDYGPPDRDARVDRDVGELDAGADRDAGLDAGEGGGSDGSIDAAVHDATPDVTTCSGDGDCTSPDLCQVGLCDLTSHSCSLVVDPCTPPDACHASAGCDPATGCAFELLDADMDGFAPLTLGSCGTDCNDDDASVFPGQTEICDGRDEDCDGVVDEGVGTACGRDLDGDHFGSSTDVLWSCTGSCPMGYVASTTDCWDEAAMFASLAHPGQRTYFTMQIRGTGGYDWNCDGMEEPINNRVFVACMGMGTTCDAQSGWVGALPTCGTTAVYQVCQTDALLNCVPGMMGVASTVACR